MHSKLTYKNLLVAIYLIALSSLPTAAQAEKTVESTEANKPLRIMSNFGIQNLTLYKLPFVDEYPTGPFENLGENQFLFISKCGDIYFSELKEQLTLIKPSIHLAQVIHRSEALGNDDNQLVYCNHYSGVKDTLLIDNSLFVSYTTWDKNQNAVRLAVSELEIDISNLSLTFKRDIFLSDPAIKEPLLGHQVGGKLALGNSVNELFLAVGDFSRPEHVQNPATSIGKVIRIDLKNLNSEVFSSGHRSPSGGLFYDQDTKELWLTEHGPHGGDEINLVKKGKNYGWPIVSYGTLYERLGMGNYYGNKFNTHEGFEKPAMTFVPSIGVGAITKYPNTGMNEYWDNDYFVAGMQSMTLYRIKKEGTKLVYAEPVLNGYRIRALKIDAQGHFYIKTDHNQFLVSD